MVDVSIAVAGATGGMTSGIMVAVTSYPALALTGGILSLALPARRRGHRLPPMNATSSETPGPGITVDGTGLLRVTLLLRLRSRTPGRQRATASPANGRSAVRGTSSSNCFVHFLRRRTTTTPRSSTTITTSSHVGRAAASAPRAICTEFTLFIQSPAVISGTIRRATPAIQLPQSLPASLGETSHPSLRPVSST